MTIVLQRWVADDWEINCTVNDPSGVPIDVSSWSVGGDFIAEGSTIPYPLNAANKNAFVTDAKNGKFLVIVPRVLTQVLASDHDVALTPDKLPTRLKLWYIDAYLRRQTVGLILFETFDGTEIVPIGGLNEGLSIVYQNAMFQIEVVASQGPAGPTNIAAAQISDAGNTGIALVKAASPAAARGTIGALGGSRTEVDDASYTLLPADIYVGFASLTAQRTVTLCSPTQRQSGLPLRIGDESGACSAANPIRVAAPQGCTVNGQPFVDIASPYGYLDFQNNNNNLWTG